MKNVQKPIVIIVSLIAVMFLFTAGNDVFAIEYSNEKCGVSIQHPEDWEVENNDYKAEKLRSVVDIYPDPENYLNEISINIWDISDYKEKTIEYVSEIFEPFFDEGGFESDVIQDNIIQIGGFPAQKLAYSEEFEGSKTYFMDVNILAYDKVYQIELETDDQEKFDKYTPFVEEIANSIKISKPNFEGINC
jgi:hypothetical protein